jgi:L-lactate dehydrogenase complex protein LldE
VKYPDISGAILDSKLGNILDTEAGAVLAGDLGCLMQIAGGLEREHARMDVRHVAEVLAGMTDTPGIGSTAKPR